jgi:hypothetical protein
MTPLTGHCSSDESNKLLRPKVDLVVKFRYGEATLID